MSSDVVDVFCLVVFVFHKYPLDFPVVDTKHIKHQSYGQICSGLQAIISAGFGTAQTGKCLSTGNLE